jgi:ADP-ribosylglycohydrolase
VDETQVRVVAELLASMTEDERVQAVALAEGLTQCEEAGCPKLRERGRRWCSRHRKARDRAAAARRELAALEEARAAREASRAPL